MEKIRIGIICPSEIAFRRFMPAVAKCDDIEYIGVSHANSEEWAGDGKNADISIIDAEHEKAKKFIESYGGKLYESYMSMITSDDIDAVYLPLPPALHFKWAKKALEFGKHILVEKPFTIDLSYTKELLEIAKEKHLAVHENYMFIFHNQLDEIEQIIKSGEIGDVRLYRISFGFPLRSANDFRYNKSLGGGALIDAGGYTLKYASRLLGDTAKVVYANKNDVEGFEVDMYGSAALINENGVTAQIAFGMDNNYKCELEAWCSKGCLTTGRVLTAPDGFEPDVVIRKGNEDEIRKLSADDTFHKSIMRFIECVKNEHEREINYNDILKQSKLVESFNEKAKGEF